MAEMMRSSHLAGGSALRTSMVKPMWSELKPRMRMLPPDDIADAIQNSPPAEREALLGLLDDTTKKEVTALLAYAEDDAGGLMNPRPINGHGRRSSSSTVAFNVARAWAAA